MKGTDLRRAAGAIILALLFTACTTVPMALPEVDIEVKRMEPPPGKALLYVYRGYIFFGSGVVIEPKIDGQRLGGLAVNSFLVALLEPGQHLYLGGNAIPLRVKAGETYFIEASAVVEDHLVEEERGRKALADYGLIYESSDPVVIDSAQIKSHKIAATSAPVATSQIHSDVDDPAITGAPLQKNAYAVVVGIEQYRQKLPTADFATADARAVTTYLTKVLGYPEENVVTLLNDRASYVDLAKYFEKWLPNNVETGGTVFIYYSGHGAPNPKTGDAYLVPYDGDPAFIDETGYSLKRMYAALGKLPAKSIVVALDSCFSGAGGRSVIAKGARSITMNLKETALPSRNMTVLAASSGEQMSSTYDEKGHGLFTYFFLKGIKNEDVVAADGSLRLDDLFAYLQPQVERVARKQFNNEQTPQLIGAGR